MRLRNEIMMGAMSAPRPLLPASASPVMITDDIALNLAAIVLDQMGRADQAAELRDLLPEAEGKVQGEPYQEQAGKWGPAAAETGPDGYTPVTGPGDGLLVHSGYGQCGAVITEATRHQHDDWHRELAERVYGDG
jgi:hypothetical protein